MRHLLVVILMLASASPSWAAPRRWTSRSGSFSLEAELADVRDGHAVLKKMDGTEVSVPLSKLSLADVRYIEEELRSAETALGATPEPKPAPAGTSPAPIGPRLEAEKATPSHRAPIGASAIRYGWKLNRSYMYRLKVEAQLGDVAESFHGTVIYTVKAVSKDGVVELEYSGGSLDPSRNRARNYWPSSIRYPRRVPYQYDSLLRSPSPGTGTPDALPDAFSRVKVDRFGRILSVEGGQRLPYLLGQMAHLPLEQLGSRAGSRWTVRNDIGVALNQQDWLPESVRRAGRQEHLPATEKSTYRVQGSDAQGIHLAKTYEMASVASVDDKPRVAMSGDGHLTFDPQNGVFSSSKMKMRLALRDSGFAMEVTTTVSYELVTEAERAKMKADGEKAMEAVRQRTRELERPVTAEEVDRLLKDLGSGDSRRMFEANMRLTMTRPQKPNRKLAAGLESLARSGTIVVRRCAAQALEIWATQESIPTLLKLLDDEDPIIRVFAVPAVGRLKATSAIDRLVELWPKLPGVSDALIAMGPAAEPAVLKQLGSNNKPLRNNACEVLQAIGTRKSIPALEKTRDEGDPLVQIFAQKALDAIRRRP